MLGRTPRPFAGPRHCHHIYPPSCALNRCARAHSPSTYTHTHTSTHTHAHTHPERGQEQGRRSTGGCLLGRGEGAKSKAAAKREAEEAKRQEQLAKKAELKRLQEQEEAALARPKVNAAKAGRVSGPKVGRGRSRARPVSQQQSGCPVC
jgi:hypothetical protein